MKRIIKRWQNYKNSASGTALVEAALLIPVMLTLLMGAVDIGTGIVLSQRTVSASQTGADLMARNVEVGDSEIENIIDGAELVFEPYAAGAAFGIDIVSVQFNASGNANVVCRETRNMSPNDEAIESVDGLGTAGEGMVIVTVQYQYEPYFASIFIPDFTFREVAFTRGRRSAVVNCV